MKSQLWFLILSVVLLSACKKVDKMTQFDMDYESTVTISSTIGVNLPFNIYTPDITTNSESVCEVNNTRKDLIEKLVLQELKLTITNPTTGNFDFLKSIIIYITADGLPETEVARNDNIQDGIGMVLTLTPVTTDLKEYIKKDKFILKVTTVTDQIITSDYTIKVNANFFVDAEILGQ